MLHNSGPFGPSEVPVNMGASVNMTSVNGITLPNGLTVGKSNQIQTPNYNLPAYPSYGAPINQPNAFQTFPSNVFHSFPSPNPPNVQNWNVAPMNLQMQHDNGANPIYEKKDFASEFNHCLNGKSIPLSVPQVPTKAYHKESSMNPHLNNFQSYQSPTLRHYLEHNIDLISKPQKFEPSRQVINDADYSIKNVYGPRRAENVDDLGLKLHKPEYSRHLNYNPELTDKSLPLDGSRQRSLGTPDSSVKPQKPEPVRNFLNYDNFTKTHLTDEYNQKMVGNVAELIPSHHKAESSRHILNYNLNHNKPDQTRPLVITEDLSLKSQKPEHRQLLNYDANLSNKLAMEESRHKRLEITGDVSLKLPRPEPRLQFQNYNLDLSNKSQPTDESRLKMQGVTEDVTSKPQMSELRQHFLNYNLDLSTKSQKDESRQRSEIMEGLSHKQARSEPRQFPNYESELSTKSPAMDESRRRTLENTVKMIENILIHNTPSSSKHNDSATTTKIDSTHNSIQSNDISKIINNKDNETMVTRDAPKEFDSDNDLQKSPEREPCNSKIENSHNLRIEASDNVKFDNDISRPGANDNTVTNSTGLEEHGSCIENIDIKIEFDSDVESQDVKPSVSFIDSTKEGDVTKDVPIVIKVEEVSHWSDVENNNPFQRDTFGLMYEDTMDGTVMDSDVSMATVKEMMTIGNQASSKPIYYECTHCNLYFSNPKRFMIHTKWHSFGLTNEKRIELQKEKELQRQIKKEAKHMKHINESEIKDDDILTGKAFKCNSCDKVFSTRGSLKNHKQRYHPTRVRECKLCDKSVVGWVAMRAHLATHTSDSRYQCNDCPKRFKYSHSLAKHRDTHLEKTLGCTKCPKMFGSKALLSTHMKTHDRASRGMSFHCSYCGKGFFESYNLQVHERTHRNERPFLCDICNTSFGTNSSLKRHVKVSHSSSKPYECTTCHRSFVSELIRDRHSMRSHGNPDDFKYPCKQCSCRYLNMKDLRKHVYKNHPKGRRKRKQPSESE